MLLSSSLMNFLLLSSSAAPMQAGANEILAQLSQVRLDNSQVYAIRNVTIERSAVSLSFTRGVIAFLEPVNGRVTGAVFVGDGEVRMVPPDQVERNQLAHFTGTGNLDEKFNTAVLRFTDGTAEQIRNIANDRTAARLDALGPVSTWETTLRALSPDSNFRILMDLLGRGERPFFLAAVNGVKYGWFSISYDEREPEELVVSSSTRPGAAVGDNIWSSFHRSTSSENSASRRVYERPFDVLSYSLSGRCSPDPEEDLHARLGLRLLWDGERVLKFNLSHELRVQAVKVNGTAAPFIQELRGQNEARAAADDPLVIILPAMTRRGQEWTIDFDYHGRAFRRLGNSIFYADERDAWYPRPDWPDPAQFEITFEVPKKGPNILAHRIVAGDNDKKTIFGFSASNLKILETEHRLDRSDLAARPNVEVERWTSERDLFALGFNYGDFTTITQAYKSVPVTVISHDDAQAVYEDLRQTAAPAGKEAQLRSFFTAKGGLDTRQSAADIGLYDPSRLGSQILAEVGEQFSIFMELFRRFPFSRLAVLQFPADFVNGVEGMLYASTGPFLDPSLIRAAGLEGALDRDALEYNRALRIALQWFGNAVGSNSYRDRWLIDGLTGYSGVLYMEKRYPDTGRGRAALAGLRDLLLMPTGNDPSGRPTTHDDTGPVWLGRRLNSARTPNAYVETVYTKSVWIMHMLRMLMQTPNAEDKDAAFLEMIRDFMQSYDRRMPTTSDFKSVAERHMTAAMDLKGKSNLDWFFNEWVFSTGIPEYTLEYGIHQTPEGQVVSGRVRQSGVTDFIMPVPIYSQSSAGELTYLGSVVVSGEDAEFKFPVRSTTAAVLLDPYDTVLKLSVAN